MAAVQAQARAQAQVRAEEQIRATNSEALAQVDSTMELEFDAEDGTVRKSACKGEGSAMMASCSP